MNIKRMNPDRVPYFKIKPTLSKSNESQDIIEITPSDVLQKRTPNRNNPNSVSFQVKNESSQLRENKHAITLNSEEVVETLKKKCEELTKENLRLKNENNALKAELLRLEERNKKLSKEKDECESILLKKSTKMADLEQKLSLSSQQLLESNEKQTLQLESQGKRKLSPKKNISGQPTKRARLDDSSNYDSENKSKNNSDTDNDSDSLHTSQKETTENENNSTNLIEKSSTKRISKRRTNRSKINLNTLSTSNQLVRSFKLSDIEPFNKAIWKDLSNNSANGMIIKLDQINVTYRKECKRVVNYALGLISTQLDRRTAFSKICKTLIGFTVQLRCYKSNVCNAHWSIRINIDTDDVTVYCTNFCNHLLSDQPKKCEIQFKPKKPLSEEVWKSITNSKNCTMPCMSELTRAQKSELGPVFDGFKKQISKLGIKTQYKCGTKTENGYTFYRACNYKSCRASVNLKINYAESEGIIILNEDCLKHRR